MKKTVSVCLSLMLVLSLLLSACGGGDKKTDPSETSLEGLIPEKETAIDFYGEKITVLQDSPVTEPFSYPENTGLADAVMDRLKNLETELNCTFGLEYRNRDALTNYIKDFDAACNYYADIVFAPNSCRMRVAAQGGSFVPIDDVSDILDYHDHEKWGSVAIYEGMMCKGVLYAVAPQTWVDILSIPYYSLVYNRALVTGEYGMADPHELYESKTWTRDAFEEYIINCTTVEDGKTKVYGLSATSKHLARQAILSNGCQMVDLDENGNLSCGWTCPEAIEALTWAQTFLTEHRESVCYQYNSDWDSYIPFVEENASFLLTHYRSLFRNVAYKVEDFGLMPWPSGPNMPYGQWVGYYENTPAASIPLEAKDIQWSAIAIDRIFEPLDEYPDFEAVKNYYAGNVLHDDLDVEIFFLNRDNPLTQYCYWPDGGDDFLNKIQSVVYSPTASVTEMIEKNMSLLEKVIESDIYPNSLVLDHYR